MPELIGTQVIFSKCRKTNYPKYRNEETDYVCVLVHSLRSLLGGNLNLDMEGKERTKKEADPLQTGRWQLSQARALTTRLVSGSCKMSRSLPSPARILGVYVEALVGFSHMYCPGGLNTTSLSQGCVLEMAPAIGTGGRMYRMHSQDRRVRSL